MPRFKFVSMQHFNFVSVRRLKLALVISTITIFFIACAGDTAVTNQTTDANTTANRSTPATPAATPANAAATTTAPPDEFRDARATYNATCIRCHKENGEGGVVELDEDMKLEVPNFKKGHALTHTDAQFARKIANGGDGMPAFKERLTPEQIDALVRFVRHEFQAGLIKDSAAH